MQNNSQNAQGAHETALDPDRSHVEELADAQVRLLRLLARRAAQMIRQAGETGADEDSKRTGCPA